MKLSTESSLRSIFLDKLEVMFMKNSSFFHTSEFKSKYFSLMLAFLSHMRSQFAL